MKPEPDRAPAEPPLAADDVLRRQAEDRRRQRPALDRRQALWDLRAMVVIVLGAMLATLPLGLWIDEPWGPLDLAAVVAVGHGGMFAGTLWILRRRGASLADLGCSRPSRGYPRTMLLAVPTLIVMWLVLFLVVVLFELTDNLKSVEPQLPIAPASRAWLPVWLAIAMVIGFVEELVFRGLLLRRLTEVFATAGPINATVMASLLSSLTFGLMHGLDPAVVATTGTIGLYLALVTRREGGNLALAVMVHAAQDLIAFSIHASR